MNTKRQTPLAVRLGLYACMGLFAGCMWFTIANNYQYDSVAGDYTYKTDSTRCTVHLHADHTFEEDLQANGQTIHTDGTWNLFDESHLSFSGTFAPPPGAELNDSRIAQGQFTHLLGLFPRFRLAPQGTGPLFKRHWF